MTMSDFLTYRQVRDALNELSDEQLDMTASVYEPSTNEVVPISECFVVINLPDAHQEELNGVVERWDQPLLVIGPSAGLQ